MAVKTLADLLAENKTRMVNDIKYRVKSAQKSAEKIAATMEFVERCQEAGVAVPYPTNSWDAASPSIEVTDPANLPFIRSVVGPLKEGGYEPIHQNDARKREVKQNIVPENEKFKHITFWQKKKLPKGANCRLVRRESSYVTMVCDKE